MIARRNLPVIAASAVVLVTAAVITAVLVTRTPAGSAGGQQDAQGAAAAEKNPLVDPGTPLLGTPAPGFALTDQFGHRVTLSQFRGKAVVLAFVDSRCTTICPLTTESMVEAVRLLGPAAAGEVQLLGIDANPDATTVADVRAYSRTHQMTSSWRFLTGSRRQLAAVWRAYHVYVAASHGNIDHEPAIYLIGPDGRERTLFLTQMAYAAVPQQAQLLADGLSKLLPGHPRPQRLVSLSYRPGIRPSTPVSLPVTGGSGSGTVRLGPGRARVVVFTASWVSEVSDVTAQLRALNAYQQHAAARRLPEVVLVDEVPTEPSPDALAALLHQAGRLSYPVAADTSGRVADGYQVTDLPWISVVSARGQVVYHHDGWLAPAALTAAVRKAMSADGGG
jgi:cytochrome oxidase Cu insertion factor (SCO1/SenC/PrrC family)